MNCAAGLAVRRVSSHAHGMEKAARRTSSSGGTGARAGRKWSARVMATSNALDLVPAVFNQPSARRIAESLKRSAEQSRRRKSSPFRSAMSMLTFYINRGGRNLSTARKRTLERAKDELRALFGRSPNAAKSGESKRSTTGTGASGGSSRRSRATAGRRRRQVHPASARASSG
jgi:hypothetical protein